MEKICGTGEVDRRSCKRVADNDLIRYHLITKSINQSIKISGTADSKMEIRDNDNVQPLTDARKGCCQR